MRSGRCKGDVASALDGKAQTCTAFLAAVLRKASFPSCLTQQNTSGMARSQRDAPLKRTPDVACSGSQLEPLPLCACFSFFSVRLRPADISQPQARATWLVDFHPATQRTCGEVVPVHSPASCPMALRSEFSPPRVAVFPLACTLGSVSSAHPAQSWGASSRRPACFVRGCLGVSPRSPESAGRCPDGEEARWALTHELVPTCGPLGILHMGGHVPCGLSAHVLRVM